MDFDSIRARYALSVGLSIKGILEDYTFRDLMGYSRKLEIDSNSFDSKEELKELIKGTLMSGYENIYMNFDFESYSFIKGIADEKLVPWACDPKLSYSCIISGLAVKDHGLTEGYVLPYEAVEVFRDFDSPELVDKVKENSEIYSLINGCMNSYGLIPYEELFGIVSMHSDVSFDDNRFREALAGCELIHGKILTDGDLVCSRCFEEKKRDYYIEEQAKYSDFDYKVFTKEEILYNADPMNTPEDPCYWKLMRLLKKHFKCDEGLCRVSTAILSNYARASYQIEESIKYIIMELGMLTADFMMEFEPLYCEYNNFTPKWALKGYTPTEIMEVQDPRFLAHLKRVNDPENGSGRVVPFKVKDATGKNKKCPCGSGKLHRDCCGRN